MDRLSHQVLLLEEADRYERVNEDFKAQFRLLTPSIWIPDVWPFTRYGAYNDALLL